jgi:hypothetical protein
MSFITRHNSASVRGWQQYADGFSPNKKIIFYVEDQVSYDGLVWYPAPNGPRLFEADLKTSVNNQFIIINQNSIDPSKDIVYKSSNGYDWWERNLSIAYTTQSLYSISAEKTEGVIIGIENLGTPWYTSSDYQSWTYRGLMPTNSFNQSCNWQIAYGNGIFVAVSLRNDDDRGAGLCTRAPGDSAWKKGSITSNYFSAIAYGANGFMATGQSGIIVSTDGIIWASRASPLPFYNRPGQIVYGNGLYVILSQQFGDIYCTSDGAVTWTQANIQGGREIVYGAGKFFTQEVSGNL